MDCCKFTPFGLCVKTELMRRGKTQEWLIAKVKAETGLYVDSSYLYKILTGQRNAQKVVQTIQDILDLPEDRGDV